MRQRKTIKWLALSVAEPIPISYGDPRYSKESGPYTLPNSVIEYLLDTPQNRAWAELKRQSLAKDGYTMTIKEYVSVTK